LPYLNIHKPDQPRKVFPPYKDVYDNDVYKWSKPTLCICNRANIEWKHAAINYFDADILDWLFAKLKPHYEIVYFPVAIPKDIQDHEKPIEINDIQVAQRHGVKLFTELADGRNWNDVMLRVFANCEHYITMNGGYSILASYFSGMNIIYSKPGHVQARELGTYEFWRWYPNINDVRTLHVPSYEVLKQKVQTLYIDKLPTANVLIRTSGRPNYFATCIKSVLDQDYPNVNIVVICDDEDSLKYTHGYPLRCFMPDKVARPPQPQGEAYGVYFPANDYIRQALEKVAGYVFVMDDDDMYTDRAAISKVMAKVKPDSLTCWRVRFPDRTVPDKTFGVKPTLYDIDSNGMCWHTSMDSDWSPFKRADYRTAAKFKNVIWIDEILAAVQNTPGNGKRKDKMPLVLNKKKNTMKALFKRSYQGNSAGDIIETDWLTARYLIRRGIAIEHVEPEPQPEPVEEKQETPVLEDKELKPKRVRKSKKAE